VVSDTGGQRKIGNLKYHEHFSNVYFTEHKTLKTWSKDMYMYSYNLSYIIEKTSSNSDKKSNRINITDWGKARKSC